MFVKIVLLFAAVVAVSANRVAFRPCGAGQHTPEWFESDDCTATRCTLRQGQTFTGRALVILPRVFQTLDLALRASVLGVNVNLSIAPGYDSACHNLEGGFSCPAPANTPIVWGLRFPIQEPFNLNNLIIEVEARDANGVAACAQIDADLVA